MLFIRVRSLISSWRRKLLLSGYVGQDIAMLTVLRELHSPVAGAFGFDIAGEKIDIKGVGKAPVSFTTREDIASYLAYVLTSLPKKDLEWRAFKIEGDRLVSVCIRTWRLTIDIEHNISHSMRLLT